jgi:aldehyde:ferredoxin oxidoreductase
MCKFAFLPPASVLSILNMVTGWDMKLDEFLKVGERTYNLKRVFNITCGATRSDDTLPKRFLEEPLHDGGSKGQIVELELMLKKYYEERGWSEKGIPKEEKLKELDLSFTIPRLNR